MQIPSEDRHSRCCPEQRMRNRLCRSAGGCQRFRIAICCRVQHRPENRGLPHGDFPGSRQCYCNICRTEPRRLQLRKDKERFQSHDQHQHHHGYHRHGFRLVHCTSAHHAVHRKGHGRPCRNRQLGRICQDCTLCIRIPCQHLHIQNGLPGAGFCFDPALFIIGRAHCQSDSRIHPPLHHRLSGNHRERDIRMGHSRNNLPGMLGKDDEENKEPAGNGKYSIHMIIF